MSFAAAEHEANGRWKLIERLLLLDRHLSFAQKSFSGNRYSDHIAMLHAFIMYSRVARKGPDAEQDFCEHKQISVPTMRVTAEAKVSTVGDVAIVRESMDLRVNFLRRNNSKISW